MKRGLKEYKHSPSDYDYEWVKETSPMKRGLKGAHGERLLFTAAGG